MMRAASSAPVAMRYDQVSGVFKNSAHLISRFVRSSFFRKPHPALNYLQSGRSSAILPTSSPPFATRNAGARIAVNETSANTERAPAITAMFVASMP